MWAWSIEAAYYKEVCVLALRLACGQPGPPVASMGELVARLDPAQLAKAWHGHPAEASLVKTLKDKMGDVQLRLANLGAAAGGLLDGQRRYATEDGVWSGRASVTHRHRAKVDANSVRQLGVGEAIVISRGRAARMLVIPAPGANNGLALPRRPFAVAGRVPGRLRARQGPSVPSGRPTAALDPPGSDPARGYRPPGAGQEQPPNDRDRGNGQRPEGGEAIEEP